MSASLPTHIAYRAFLFDMDGTLLNSIAAAERIWTRWAVRHGVDVATFLPTIHGVRAIDTIARQHLPGVDAQAEAEQITREEIEDVEGVVQVPGAQAFLNSLPPECWAIVTSAPMALALRRMEAAGIPRPWSWSRPKTSAMASPTPPAIAWRPNACKWHRKNAWSLKTPRRASGQARRPRRMCWW